MARTYESERGLRRTAAFAVIAMVVLAAPATARADDFVSGLEAFNSGDYVRAFVKWQPMAQGGHAKSQASLGFLYYAGKGVARDDAKALHWFRIAAEAGQPTAQFFLGLQYFYGRGVPRDLARAHSWCDIALTNGYTESLFCRDAVALEMSSAEMRRSSDLTTEFLSTHPFRN